MFGGAVTVVVWAPPFLRFKVLRGGAKPFQGCCTPPHTSPQNVGIGNSEAKLINCLNQTRTGW